MQLSTAAAACLLFLYAASAQAQTAPPFARLVLFSPHGDWVGGGSTHDITYTPENSYSFFVDAVPWYEPRPSFVRFSLGVRIFEYLTPWASLDFGTNQLGHVMRRGMYVDAERASFASPGHPGMDVGFDHRGCNQVAGSFRVHGVAFADPSTILTITASYLWDLRGAVIELE